MTPLERAAVLDAARKGAFQLLLVSDVAARGIDMPQVSVGVTLLCYSQQSLWWLLSGCLNDVSLSQVH
jgi:superfamily II DNA or RNA helicase